MLKYGKKTDYFERYNIFYWHDGEQIKTCKIFIDSVTNMF